MHVNFSFFLKGYYSLAFFLLILFEYHFQIFNTIYIIYY